MSAYRDTINPRHCNPEKPAPPISLQSTNRFAATPWRVPSPEGAQTDLDYQAHVHRNDLITNASSQSNYARMLKPFLKHVNESLRWETITSCRIRDQGTINHVPVQ